MVIEVQWHKPGSAKCRMVDILHSMDKVVNCVDRDLSEHTGQGGRCLGRLEVLRV